MWRGSNCVEFHIAPHPDGHVVLIGKGASGAAVQNLNLMLGLPETTGLAIADTPTSTAYPHRPG